MFISFAVLIFGGLNYMLMALFRFDMFAEMFGGVDAIASRIFYAMFGIAALTLLTIVIVKAFFGNKEKKATTAPKRTVASA